MPTEVLDELLDPLGDCLTLDAASKLAAFRVSTKVQARIDELAERCSDGTLTAEERSIYESYVRTINFMGVLQAKARRILASAR